VSTPRIREAGESALVLEFEALIDPLVNARAIAAARAVRDASIPGVRDVVSTYRTVAVYFDPLSADAAIVRQALERAAQAPAAAVTAPTVEVPVAYGGPWGPDLERVAAAAGLTTGEVVRLHTGEPYRVYMLGFLPGFPYMGMVPEPIAAPRRPSPRLRVPRGSVGIAGRQTGVYPCASPGGWQIIGRTPTSMFDAALPRPAAFGPGDVVRFVAIDGARAWAADDPAAPTPATVGTGPRCVTVIQPGFFTTVQDGGRWGYQSIGVTVSGALDPDACAGANRLVGNDAADAVLEVTIAGPELRAETDVVVAVAGADLGATIDGVPLAVGQVRRCRSGSVIRFGRRRMGARAYLAFDGGLAAPPVLGSRATHVPSALGGLAGRQLIAGDRLAIGASRAGASAASGPAAVGGVQPGAARSGVGPPPGGGVRVRVLPGPQEDWFPESSLETLLRSRFTVSAQSNRMAYRLNGPPLARLGEREMISDATFVGAIQVPPSGQPILLLADRPTTGGYPQIAVVAGADLPLAAQLAPGDWIEFGLCTRDEAIDALRRREGARR
jgi:KipI family sensor histidine kinase inhibitor